GARGGGRAACGFWGGRPRPRRSLWLRLGGGVLLEPGERALPRHLRARLVKAAALVAVEAVAGVLVDVDVAVEALLLDDLDVAQRNALVLVAEMHLRRAARLLVREGDDPAAVVAHGGREPVEPAGGEERERAAHAEADDRHRAHALELADRRGGVTQHRVPVGVGDELARLLDLLGRIAGLEILDLAVEQSGRHRHIAFGSEAVADVANVM